MAHPRERRSLRSIEDRVCRFGQNHALWKPGDRLLLAVSGGVDSLCMLHLLARITRRAGFSLIVAHLNHGMRADAEEDQQFVRAQAVDLGLRLIEGSADVPQMAGTKRVGLEEAGRMARRQFLDSALPESGAAAIATAHTRSDHVETVLLNLLRGAGLHGVQGIPPRGFGARIRPLLCLDRDDTIRYCEALQLAPRRDPANDDLRFLRNRIRHTVLPLLRQQVNPAVDDALARFSIIASGFAELIHDPAETLFLSVSTSQPGTYLRGPLREAPSAIAAEVIRMALEAARGTPEGVGYIEIDRIVRSLFTGGHTPLVGGFAEVSGLYLRIVLKPGYHRDWSEAAGSKAEPRAPDVSRVGQELPIPGRVTLRDGDWITASVGDSEIRISDQKNGSDSFCGWVCPPLYVRMPQPGDRMRPLRRRGSRKLADLFQERGIPTWERSEWPVVADQRGIVWVPRVAIDEAVASPGPNLAAVELTRSPVRARPSDNLHRIA